jgi:hypothetical protein
MTAWWAFVAVVAMGGVFYLLYRFIRSDFERVMKIKEIEAEKKRRE